MWAASAALTAAGSIVTRSFRPLPSRIMSWFVAKSTSFTRRPALQQAQARAVQQDRHQPWHAIEPPEDGADLLARQHDRQVLGPLGPDDVVEPRQLDAEHVAIQKQQGAQRLVLGRGRDFVLDRERGQELGDLGGAHLHGMALAVEKDVALDPVDVRFLGATAVVSRADSLSDAVE